MRGRPGPQAPSLPPAEHPLSLIRYLAQGTRLSSGQDRERALSWRAGDGLETPRETPEEQWETRPLALTVSGNLLNVFPKDSYFGDGLWHTWKLGFLPLTGWNPNPTVPPALNPKDRYLGRGAGDRCDHCRTSWLI